MYIVGLFLEPNEVPSTFNIHVGKCHWSFLLLLIPYSQNQEEVEHAALSQLKLKDYELGERLGEGSSNGAVYAAKYNEHEVK